MIIREFNIQDISNGLLETYKEVWNVTEISETTAYNFLSNHNYMVVAEIDGAVIGTATLHLQQKMIRNGGIAALIEDVAVRQQYRGQKIGEQLILHLIQKAKELNCYKIILSCFDERVSFYERCGFKKECNTMRINLI